MIPALPQSLWQDYEVKPGDRVSGNAADLKGTRSKYIFWAVFPVENTEPVSFGTTGVKSDKF